ncbi:MAG: DUF1800 family protein, partial [Dehalococcoidia bacterium]
VNLAMDVNFMGQEILNPPTVEGWHTGREWIDTGNLVERVNSAALEIGDLQQPGVQAILRRVRALGDSLTPEQLVESCLDGMGLYDISQNTRQNLVRHAQAGGDLQFSGRGRAQCSEGRVAEMLQLIVASREYQLA